MANRIFVTSDMRMSLQSEETSRKQSSDFRRESEWGNRTLRAL
jgi:hypothetical protein